RHTLLPYLTALVNDGKIDADIAVALNRLARPVEYVYDGTSVFVEAVERQSGGHVGLARGLIQQFEDDNPVPGSYETLRNLVSVAKRTFGNTSPTTRYLVAAEKSFKEGRKVINSRQGYSPFIHQKTSRRGQAHERENRKSINAIIKSTDP